MRNIIKKRDYNKQWYLNNKEKHCYNNKSNHLRVKLLVLDHYGNKCVCCNEKEISFLAIDHINGGGNKHRKKEKLSSGDGMYRWLRDNGYPSEFQILCHNCNHSKNVNGKCIHELKRLGIQSEKQKMIASVGERLKPPVCKTGTPETSLVQIQPLAP